jgi:hypothetical protein
MSSVFSQPHNQITCGGAMYNLIAIGVCWIFADFVVGGRWADRNKTGVDDSTVRSHADLMNAETVTVRRRMA